VGRRACLKARAAGIEDAIALAVDKHRGQKDKAGLPYILHPLRVMQRLDWNAPEDAKYEDFITRVLPNPIARMVKRADLEDNMDVRRLVAVGDSELIRLLSFFPVTY
jgi:hypothetical protein